MSEPCPTCTQFLVVVRRLPANDVPLEEGPFTMVERSHHFADLIGAIRGHDVDREPSRPGHATSAGSATRPQAI
jgi:hypothetical protein